MGLSTMDREPGFESSLIDLDDVPLAVLRTLDGAALYRSLRHAVEMASQPQLVSNVENYRQLA